MKKNKVSLMLIIILVLVIALPGAHTVNAMGKISGGSGIAGTSLEKKSFEEAKTILEEEVNQWLSQEPLLANSDYETEFIPRHIFQFHIEDTLYELDELTKRKWTNFFMKKKNVQIPLQASLIPNYEEELGWSESINTKQTLEKALLIAKNLLSSTVGIEYEEQASFEEFEIARISLPLLENYHSAISPIIEDLDGRRIGANELYSFIREIELPEGIANLDERMSFVASGLYELVLQTELEIIERHQSDVTPIFTEAGLEAMIVKEENQNLLIYNPSTNIFIIHGEISGGAMVLTISSTKQEEKISITRKNEKEIEPRTIYRYIRDHVISDDRVISEGVPGLQVEIYRSIDGEKKEMSLISRDFYPPQHRVILTSNPALVNEEDSSITDPSTGLDGLGNNSGTPNQNGSNNGGTNSQSFTKVLSERVSEILQCEGDLACEEENGVTVLEKTLTTCLTTDSPANEYSVCGGLYQYIFSQLLENNEVNESDKLILNSETMLEDYLREKLLKGDTSGEDEVIKGNEE